MNNEILVLIEEKMKKTIGSFEIFISKIRTGRANPLMLEHVMVDFYGTPTPINQTAQIQVPEPQQLLIKPYDKSQIGAIINGINKADLGINPQAEGDAVRLVIPALTEDVRKDLVKKLQKEMEQFKVEIRNSRRDGMDKVKNNKEISEDEVKGLENDIQKLTDKYIGEIESIAKNKEKELMTI
jgi:ribosome recycling factor